MLLVLQAKGDDDEDVVLKSDVIVVVAMFESFPAAAGVAAALSRDCDIKEPIIHTPLPELGAENTTPASADDERNIEEEASDNARGR